MSGQDLTKTLFRTILSFCSMLARNFSCAMLHWQLQQPVIIEKLTGLRQKVMLRWYCTGFFPVQCYLESLGQHCRRILSVQCCAMSIKTTLNRIFFCASLSWDSWTTLQVLVQFCPKTKIEQNFLFCNVVWSLKNNIAWPNRKRGIRGIDGIHSIFQPRQYQLNKGNLAILGLEKYLKDLSKCII